MAGRIPQSFLDDLLERVDLVDIVDRRVKLKKTGKNYSARCPFHDEKTPSFTVNPDKQFFYCFGCGAGGNALGFIMDYDNVDFPQAVETLANGLGLAIPREDSGRGGQTASAESQHRPLYALLEKTARFYQHALRTHAQASRAVDYLKGRGLSGEIARSFGLGFAPPGWDNLLKALGDGDEPRRQLLDTGMLVRNDAGRLYDRFRDRIVFPIRDQRGRIVAFGGRVLGDDKPKYLNSPETPIFNKGRELYGLYEARQANRKLDRLLVVEGYMDVIALAQSGISNATATLGTATSKTHLERIFRLSPEVVFCFDGDEAGRKAAFRALEATLPCMTDGRQARFLFLPEGDDPDTMVRREGADAFSHQVASARPLEQFLFENLAEGLDTATLDGRARYSQQVLPYLRQLPVGVYRELMFRELAERTGLELASLMKLEVPPLPARPADGDAKAHDPRFDAAGQQTAEHREAGDPGPEYDGPYGPDPADDYPSADSPRKRQPLRAANGGHANLAQSAIALLLHKPEAAAIADPGELADLQGDDAALLRDILTLLQRRPESSTAMLLGHWYGTPEGELLNRLAGQERLIPADGIEEQFRDTMSRLVLLPQRARLEAQVDKLRSTDYALMGVEQKQELKELLHQLQQLDKRHRGG
ncbi:DNA primase [Chromatocurvus halotolerans]|uniref:DNA primase n=1 Tax=Chromatocurvus halotolerans TaxID=1132028 RepID=A0A4R2KM55_9GAMM|nr:DNA primase [Chromatocurvus halotolerans]TCO73722.1 DNA primase [Chromatocurvus halotolerans]